MGMINILCLHKFCCFQENDGVILGPLVHLTRGLRQWRLWNFKLELFASIASISDFIKSA